MPAFPARALPPDEERQPRLELVPDDRREESRRSLALLLGLLGYPEEWAVELEREEFARGVVWTSHGHGSV
jgi:hypothetical protein